MKRIFISLIFSICLQSGFSQVSGFMGRRSSLTFDLNPTSALMIPNSNHEVFLAIDDAYITTKKLTAFNYRPEMNFDFLLTEKISSGISLSKYSYGSTFAIENWETTNDPVSPNMIYIPSVIEGYSYGINIKFFNPMKNGLIPPLGNYITIGLQMSEFNSYLDKKSLQNLFEKSFKIPSISFGFGKNYIFFSNLVVQYGIDFSIPFLPIEYWESDLSFESTAQEVSQYYVYDSMSRYSLLNLNLGIGLLTF